VESRSCGGRQLYQSATTEALSGSRILAKVLDSESEKMKLRSLASRFQRRLLNSHKYEDYIFVFIIGLLHIVFSIVLGIWEHTEIENYKYTGYKDAKNFIAHIIILPAGLFLIRWMSDLLFGVNIDNNSQNRDKKVPLLSLFDKDAQPKIHDNLKKSILNPIIPSIVFVLDLIFHLFDRFREIMWQYFQRFTGQTPIKIEVNWANLYVDNKIDIITNLFFTLLAYSGQFLVFFFGISGIILLLQHNISYLNIIYQRSKDNKNNIIHNIVLDFEDPNRCFGMKNLHLVFNLQLVVLFITGLFVLCSRLVLTEQKLVFSTLYLGNVKWHDFFPEFGQIAIALSWLSAFCVVLLPAFVKFLPFFSRKKRLRSWRRPLPSSSVRRKSTL